MERCADYTASPLRCIMREETTSFKVWSFRVVISRGRDNESAQSHSPITINKVVKSTLLTAIATLIDFAVLWQYATKGVRHREWGGEFAAPSDTDYFFGEQIPPHIFNTPMF
jgi:hypothetical protein